MARSSSVTMSASTGDSVGNLQLDPGRHRLRGRQPTPPRTLGHRRHRTTSRGTGKSRLDRRIHPGGIASRGQRPARRDIVFHNLLPDGGKSGLLQNVASYAALAANTRLVLFDGKLVELGPYMDSADQFVGLNIEHGCPSCAGCPSWPPTATCGCCRTSHLDARSTAATACRSSLPSSTNSPPTPPCWAPRPNKKSPSPCYEAWSPSATPAACPSSRPPNVRRGTSSPPPCGTCSASSGLAGGGTVAGTVAVAR